MLAVNKADGTNVDRARIAARDYKTALHLLRPSSPNWTPPVVTCSALTGDGLDPLWDQIEQHRRVQTESGEWDDRRRGQELTWMWAMVEDRLLEHLHAHRAVGAIVSQIQDAVTEGELSPSLAANKILAAFEDDAGVPGNPAASRNV